ncbi:SRPBCC family protein [Spelaeicoccus albus]|uniref:Polyketide cyclase/dehydrase/lipid transport protein n=1 Tax=Spelaeicoccus albus TaxID=1280376 RepID=A0A7Z0AA81_9MICO|nr:ATPase [Spelaeicoccus albus]NYI67157.1 hypothetical protein [Spelaeicoccus albus]
MDEKLIATRTMNVGPNAIFAVLCDPTKHQFTEPTDWVRDAIDPQPITKVGQVFGMNMFNDNAGGHYTTYNEVTIFDMPRAIAWQTGQEFNDDGTLRTGGWTWRYDLAPSVEGTRTVLTYDWSAVPDALREYISFPPFPVDHLEASLACLERAATER